METQTSPITHTSSALTSVQAFTAQVYAWMTGGLLLTAAIALLINGNVQLLYWIYTNSWVIGITVLIELLVVIVLSAAVNRMSTLMAGSLFLFYSVLNGVFFSVILATYDTSTVAIAFSVTALTFLAMSVYGMVAKADLTRWGQIAIMGLVGVIIASIVNIFAQSSSLTWILTYVSVGIFLILIAYDTQKLRQFAETAHTTGNPGRYAVLGALSLYLDFINLLLLVLRILGRGDK